MTTPEEGFYLLSAFAGAAHPDGELSQVDKVGLSWTQAAANRYTKARESCLVPIHLHPVQFLQKTHIYEVFVIIVIFENCLFTQSIYFCFFLQWGRYIGF